MILTTRSRIIVRHIAFITAYFCYEIGMLYAYTAEMVFFWDAFWHLMVNLCFFYLIGSVILPYANRHSGNIKRILTALILLGAGLLTFFATKYLLALGYQHFQINTTRPYIDLPSFSRDTIWRFINISGLSFGYWFASNAMARQREVARLEQERLKDQLANETAKNELIAIENDLLKSKINFHFLFNTLTYLHESVKDLDSQAGDAIMALSDILHYSLGTPADGKVKLQEEINYVDAIFQISKLKSGGKLQINYSVTGKARNLTIIPLILVTLCENVLKYAELNQTEFPALFKVSIHDANLSIDIFNKKSQTVSPVSYGMGMKNTIKRLQIAYPDRHRLDITDTSEKYQLNLTIQL